MPRMLHTSTQQLIRKLHELTAAGALAWKEGEGETSRLETEGYIVEIKGDPATLRLLRGDGRELERADAAELASEKWPEGDGTYATRLTEMSAKARRIAGGAEQAIAKILTSLSAPPKTVAAKPAAIFGQTKSFVTPAKAPAPPAPPKPPAPAPAPMAAAPAPTPPPPEPPPSPPVAAAPAPASPPKPAPETAPIIQGFSARQVQQVETTTPADVHRALAAVAPKPAPAPAPQPQPAPTTTPAPAGQDIYKPWS